MTNDMNHSTDTTNSDPLSVTPQTQSEYVREKSEKVKQIIENFCPFGLSSFLYGFFFCFCLYRNLYGVTSPLLCIGTLIYYFYCFRALHVTAPKKQTCFYCAAIILLGISNMLTSSFILIFFNYIGIILLVFCFVLQFFYQTEKWDFSKYMASLVQTIVFCLGRLPYPFKSLHLFLKEKQSEKSQKVYQVLIGLLISVPLLFVVCSLLLSADMVFRHFSNKLFADLLAQIDMGNIILALFLFFIGMIASYCILVELAGNTLSNEIKNKKTMEPLIAITFTSVLTIIYMAFSIIQILYLFIGNMTLPENYTYAEYAREGFFQLLFVCLINLALVLFCMKHYQENRVLKGILTVICACTYIMIASSTMRMLLYIQSYQMTFLRLFVLLSLFVLFICLSGIVISIYKESFPLFSFMLVVVSISYITFSLAKPDMFIASYNLSHADKNLDRHYLYDLSYDALPVMEKAGLFEKENVTVPKDFTSETSNDLSDYWNYGLKSYALHAQETYNKMSLRKFNISVYLAGKALAPYTK